MIRALGSLVLAFALASPATAATLDIVETTDFPELTFSIPPNPSALTAMPGVNRVTGSLIGRVGEADSDSLFIEVLQGTAITEVTFTAVSITLPDVQPLPDLVAGALFFPADPSNSDSFDGASIDLRTAIDGAVSGGPSLLRGGNYFLALLFDTTSSTPVRFEEVSVDYVLEFTVTTIPLPATAWLMLAGLGGLVALRRPAARSPITRQGGLP